MILVPQSSKYAMLTTPPEDWLLHGFVTPSRKAWSSVCVQYTLKKKTLQSSRLINLHDNDILLIALNTLVFGWFNSLLSHEPSSLDILIEPTLLRSFAFPSSWCGTILLVGVLTRMNSDFYKCELNELFKRATGAIECNRCTKQKDAPWVSQLS